jgi:hypothetical protein
MVNRYKCVKMMVSRELMFLRKCIDFCVIDDDTLLAASHTVKTVWYGLPMVW